jgi:CheY-like chemotaxis protein
MSAAMQTVRVSGARPGVCEAPERSHRQANFARMERFMGRARLVSNSRHMSGASVRGEIMVFDVTVLLVEDYPLISDLMSEALTDSGYAVVLAKTGEEALQQVESDLARFRAVITDIRLGPGPDGWALAKRVRELAPHMPIVYTSGDSAQDWASKGVPGSVALTKPFAPAQLVIAVSALVNKADMHSPPAAGR